MMGAVILGRIVEMHWEKQDERETKSETAQSIVIQVEAETSKLPGTTNGEKKPLHFRVVVPSPLQQQPGKYHEGQQ